MKLKDIFRCVRAGNILRVNNEYIRIRQEYGDAIIGTQMMQNNLRCNVRLWDDLEQAMIILFQHIERNFMLKQEIISRLYLSADTSTHLIVPPQCEPHFAKDSLESKALSFYKEAYSSAVAGDTEAFRNYALDYRITSGLRNRELSALLQWVKELSHYIKLDEINTRHLWRIYQKDYSRDIGELLYKTLVNHIFQNENVYVEAYLECVSAVDARLKEVV